VLRIHKHLVELETGSMEVLWTNELLTICQCTRSDPGESSNVW